MNPAKLQKFCSYTVVELFLHKTYDKTISNADDKEYLVKLLVLVLKDLHRVVSNTYVQARLYYKLMTSLRYHHYNNSAAVHISILILLCPTVVLDQVAQFSTIAIPIASLDIPEYVISKCDCQHVMTFIEEVKVKSSDTPHWELHTQKLVLEGIGFQCETILPWLLGRMPHLTHLLLQHNRNSAVMRAIGTHCHNLETLTFIEGAYLNNFIENDIVRMFFGMYVPIKEALGYFKHNEKPTLKSCLAAIKLVDIDEIFLDEQILNDIYLLLLLTRSTIESVGRHSGLHNNIFRTFDELSFTVQEKKYPCLPCTKITFTDPIDIYERNAKSEIEYISSALHLFRRTKSIGVIKNLWSRSDLVKFIKLFENQIDSLSLYDIPYNDLTSLCWISHLRLIYTNQCTFKGIHMILDSCSVLQTLSIHSVIQPDNLHSNLYNYNHQWNQIDPEVLSEEEEQIINALQAHALQLPLNDLQLDEAVENLDIAMNGQDPPPHADPPRQHNMNDLRPVQYKVKCHPRLTTLRLTSRLRLSSSVSEYEMTRLLERLPNIRRLCLGLWLGTMMDFPQSNDSCTATTLFNVLTTSSKPLLSHMYQICYLPAAKPEDAADMIWKLSLMLPSLKTIIQPVLDKKPLKAILKKFSNTNITIQHKCDTDSVFSNWEPYH